MTSGIYSKNANFARESKALYNAGFDIQPLIEFSWLDKFQLLVP